jgi:hypothetical protein
MKINIIIIVLSAIAAAVYINFEQQKAHLINEVHFQDTISEQKSYILGLEQIIKKDKQPTDEKRIEEINRMNRIIYNAIHEKSVLNCNCCK